MEAEETRGENRRRRRLGEDEESKAEKEFNQRKSLDNNHNEIKSLLKYFKFVGIVEEQDLVGGFEAYGERVDEFDWKEYDLPILQNDRQLSEISFDLTDVVVSGNKDHREKLVEITSRFQIRENLRKVQEDALARLDAEKYSQSKEEILGVLEGWRGLDKGELAELKKDKELGEQAYFEKDMKYKNMYYSKYLKWYVEAGILVYDDAMPEEYRSTAILREVSVQEECAEGPMKCLVEKMKENFEKYGQNVQEKSEYFKPLREIM